MEPTRSDGQPQQSKQAAGAVCSRQVEPAAIRTLLSVLPRPRFAWADGPTTIAAGGAARTITATGPERFDEVSDQIQSLFESLHTRESVPGAARPRVFGGFAFSPDHQPTAESPWNGYAGAQFLLPNIQLSVSDDTAWLTTTALGPGARERAESLLQTWQARIDCLPSLKGTNLPGVRTLTYRPTKAAWQQRVQSTIDRIAAGPLEKVVLAQSLTATHERPVRVGDLLERLGETYQDCYRFLFEPQHGGTFFGATPERLVSLHDDTIETEALAGSIRRGDTPKGDDSLARQLRESAKNDHEHALVVDSICDQLSSLATDIETGDRTVRRLANVQHLETPVTAKLGDKETILSVVEALHPTPAVGGIPPEIAMETIRQQETFDRGWYAGPIGWIDETGDGTFAVAIRSGITTADCTTMFAGAGIVADSDPAEEWNELKLKYRPILDTLT